MILQVPVRILVNVGVVKINLAILHPGKGIADLPFARAQRLDLGAVQHDARLEGLQDMIIAPRFGIGQNICHITNPKGTIGISSGDTDLAHPHVPIPAASPDCARVAAAT